MKRLILVTFLLLTSLCVATTGAFVADPNTTYADDIHYDAKIHMVVIHIHAKILWFKLDEFYGLKVVNDKNINTLMFDTLGKNPEVVHLKRQ